MNPIIYLLSKLGRLKRNGFFVFNESEGITKDKADERDYFIKDVSYVPETVYVLPIKPSDYVKNQSYWNSCGSHALCTAIEMLHNIRGTNLTVPLSERHHYYNVRESMGVLPQNVGMYSRDMLKIANHIGVSPERLCPYDINKINDKPGFMADGFAHHWKIKAYYRLSTIEDIKGVLFDNYPVLIGVQVNPSFRSFTGDITVNNGETIYGGHEIVLYGFDDIRKGFYFVNSWGTGYKKAGTGFIPYQYIDKYKIDIWFIDI